jgi:hypothetical protein
MIGVPKGIRTPVTAVKERERWGFPTSAQVQDSGLQAAYLESVNLDIGRASLCSEVAEQRHIVIHN